MRYLAAILVGKVVLSLIRLFKIGGGSAAPGLYALAVEPDLVKKLASKIPKNVVITGTNGKTTTAKMLAHFARSPLLPARNASLTIAGGRSGVSGRAKNAGLKVIRNHTGSNLERGIASTLIANYQLLTTRFAAPCVAAGARRANYQFDLGIWELDEAAFNTVAPKLQPDIVVFLNVFRDQLDRYGEIDTVVNNWCQTLKNLDPKTKVLINGDDANTLKLAQCFKGKVQKFGVKDYKISGESIIHQKEQEKLDFEAKNIKLDGLKNSAFQLEIRDLKLEIHLPLPGLYHIYDFLAAFAAGINLNMQPKQMINSLKDYSPAFGRVEKLPFGYIFLIKNPAGATQVFETIAPNIKPEDRLLLALNDNIADGKDVSWIWDVEYEKCKVQSAKCKIIVSGTRAYDLAVRLKYAGFNHNTIMVETNLENALKEATRSLAGHLFILPTYTAMLGLQKILVKMGIKKHYWREE